MKIALNAILGLAFGGLLLWLTISQVDIGQAESALAKAEYAPMIVAVALYWVAIAIRIARWRLLLTQSKRLTYGEVGRSLVIGYTVNNLLPARLGELFRVDFVRREYGVARSAVLGSVILERLADALAVIALLGFGLTYASFKDDSSTIVTAALTAGAVIGFAILGLCVVVLSWERVLSGRFRWLGERLEILTRSITTFSWQEIAKVAAMTIVIWGLEAAAVAFVMSGFGAKIGIAGLSLVCGLATFSTLLPSAPGYVGSLQAAFVIGFVALGLEPVLGLLSATAVQLLLFGSVTVVGLFMLFAGQLKDAVSLVARSVRGK